MASGLTNAQRRENIVKALQKATKLPSGATARGNGVVQVGSGGRTETFTGKTAEQSAKEFKETGGTKIVIDKDTGKSKIVKVSKQEIEQNINRLKQPTTATQFKISLFKKQGYNIRKDNIGNIIGTKNGRQIVISRFGDIIKAPSSATIRTPFLYGMQRKQDRVKTNKDNKFFDKWQYARDLYAGKFDEVEEKKDSSFRTPDGLITGYKPKTISERLAFEKQKNLGIMEKSKSVEERVFRGVFVAGVLGVARGGLGAINFLRHPIKSSIAQLKALSTPLKTLNYYGELFVIDPVGTTLEFITFSRALALTGKLASRSPVGRFVREELYIKSNPKELQPYLRAIIKSSKVQERINPYNVRSIKKVDFMEVKTLNKIEARALAKTLKETDSVVFGSTASRTLSKKKTNLPKDVDLATANINEFYIKFKNNLPKAYRKKISLKGEKIKRLDGSSIMDIKGIDRLYPNKIPFFKKGYLPASIVRKTKTKYGKFLDMPTQKILKVNGIKLIGFGEQVVRKGLGTIQVLIEKNIRRAKDPQTFITGLRVQLEALKQIKPKLLINKLLVNRRIKVIGNALKILESKGFQIILEKKVKGILDEYPILKKIDVAKLKKVSKSKTIKEAKKIAKKINKKQLKKLAKNLGLIAKNLRIKKIKKSKKANTRSLSSKLPINKAKALISRLPSKIPKKIGFRIASRLPSKIPKKYISKLMSKLPNSSISQLKSILRESKIPPSKIPPSKIPPSKIPPSRTPTSKTPTSKTPTSKIPPKLLSWKKKLPKNLSFLVNPIIRVRGKNKELRLKTTPNRALKKVINLIDNTTSRSFALKIVGLTKQKDIGKVSLRKFRLRFGKDKRVLLFVEKTKYAIDTKGEKQGLKLSKMGKKRKW